MKKNEYEMIKMELIESCYKHNLNYSEFINTMMEELEMLQIQEAEEWE